MDAPFFQIKLELKNKSNACAEAAAKKQTNKQVGKIIETETKGQTHILLQGSKKWDWQEAAANEGEKGNSASSWSAQYIGIGHTLFRGW